LDPQGDVDKIPRKTIGIVQQESGNNKVVRSTVSEDYNVKSVFGYALATEDQARVQVREV